jgi:adsorption protein B
MQTGVMSEYLIYGLLVVGVIISISSIDDLLVDLLWFLRARRIDHAPLPSPTRRPHIAVFVANWHEEDVLGAMVAGNLANIAYRPLSIVLGVYPNDIATLNVAKTLATTYPDLVQLVVNRRNGPTSKGQMLNAMFSSIYANPANAPELVVLHDSEDVIDPRSFELYADRSAEYAYIQIPVFSLDSRRRSMVGATYMEEFTERHTRELLVRNALGSFIPSAGVGTCLRSDLVLHFLRARGHVLQPGTVTEDYILGAESHREGFPSTFAVVYEAKPHASMVATLEYFPKDFWAAVRQKSRWVYGNAFDAAVRLGWSGSAWDRFFFYRDRKGAITNLLAPLSLFLLVAALGARGRTLSPGLDVLSTAILAFNVVAMSVRLWVKAVSFRQIYGFYGVVGILARWPLAIVINAIAVLRAWRSFLLESRLASRPIRWVKTQHELPAVFDGLARHTSGPPPRRAVAPIRYAPRVWFGAVRLRSRRRLPER